VTVIKKGLRSPEEVKRYNNVYDIHHLWFTNDKPTSILKLLTLDQREAINIDLFENTILIKAKEDNHERKTGNQET